MAVTKKNKTNDASKKAQELKAKKKQLRDAKTKASLIKTTPTGGNKKGASIVRQSKARKK